MRGYPMIYPLMTKEQVKAVLDRVLTWPPERQEEAAEILMEIEADLGSQVYHATPDERGLQKDK
jgi:hypothetical protein